MEEAHFQVSASVKAYELFTAKHLGGAFSAEGEVIRFARCIHRAAKKPYEELACCPRDERDDYVKGCSALSVKAHQAFSELRDLMTQEDYEAYVDKHYAVASIRRRFHRRLLGAAAAAAAFIVLMWLWPRGSNPSASPHSENAARAHKFLAHLGLSDEFVAWQLTEIEKRKKRSMQNRWLSLKSSIADALGAAPPKILLGAVTYMLGMKHEAIKATVAQLFSSAWEKTYAGIGALFEWARSTPDPEDQSHQTSSE